MPVRLYEQQVTIPVLPDHTGLLSHIEQALRFRLADNETPLRFVVTETDAEHYRCEIGVVADDPNSSQAVDSIFRLVPRGGGQRHQGGEARD